MMCNMNTVPCILFVLQIFLHLSHGNTVTGTFFRLVDEDAGERNKDEPVTSEAFHACSLQNACPNVLAARNVHKEKTEKRKEKSADLPSGNAAEWRKIEFPDIFPIQSQKDGIVEVKPRDHGFAQVTVTVQSGKYKIKIVHHSGFFVCSPDVRSTSTLGCKVREIDQFWIVVTDINNKIILPGPKGFTLDGKNTPSQTKFAIYNDVIELRKGQQIRFWYMEDLLKSDWSTADNSGGVKFYAYAIKQYD
eukprot:Seg1464.6 transcript_id=Seg1464.6/GoldUCD/mRNA.D3Y31 product="hypothetical protein" protein_id=Seg1464.6/GoldUCD/D3Y31